MHQIIGIYTFANRKDQKIIKHRNAVFLQKTFLFQTHKEVTTRYENIQGVLLQAEHFFYEMKKIKDGHIQALKSRIQTLPALGLSHYWVYLPTYPSHHKKFLDAQPLSTHF